MAAIKERVTGLLESIYGPVGNSLWPRIEHLLANITPPEVQPQPELDERDAVLITYGDSFREPGEPPLRTLQSFLSHEAGSLLTGVHLLPFYPYSSDDGFSVIDYRAVDPALGGWGDIQALGKRYRLMFDGVINHVSRDSQWFQAFLQGQPPYNRYFITPGDDWDLSRVIRPRTSPLLTEFQTVDGPRKVWTTFSDDQIDLNYANPEVLLEIIDLLLFYVERGAGMIRLDAIAYLWKEPGTTCLHLPQTHAVIRLLRAVLDAVAPGVLLITETNVPHRDNISYFGALDPDTGRTNEAQLVYQFPLAPLTLHSFLTGSAEKLSAWAGGLEAPGLFFNFLASHDGIGLSPAHGILTGAEIDRLVSKTIEHGGQVSYRSNPDGTQSPYELNITFFDGLNGSAQTGEMEQKRFLASQAVLLAMAGVPGIYVHSLFGARNWQEGVRLTGRARTINRQKFDYPDLQQRLSNPSDPSAQILAGYRRMLHARRSTPAFHPRGAQRVIDAGPRVFALERLSQDGAQAVLALVNVTPETQPVRLSLSHPATSRRDLLDPSARYSSIDGNLILTVLPYQVCWLYPSA